jgi:uncharacterized repeat protein (TIGR01451 family)
VDVGEIEGGGGSVTITFQVIIDRPLSAGVTQVLNQGFIHGSNFETEPTDDPDTGLPDDPTITQVDAVAIDPLEKTDSLLIDADDDGRVSNGDTLLYEITFWNVGDMDATGVIFTDTPHRETKLVAGSVTTSKGSVTRGNNPGDTTVEVYVGDVQGLHLEEITVSFHVIIVYRWDYHKGNRDYTSLYIYNQGIVSSNEQSPVSTNDPETPVGLDPTRTSYGILYGVPVFPNLYVGVAAALMAGILAYFLRRRLIHRE